MKDVVVGSIVEILQKLQERKKEIIEEIKETKEFYREQEEQKTILRRNYEKFSHIEELQNYYTQVMFCRLIFLDIKNRTIYLKKMERYCEGIQNLNADDILSIRYNDEYQEYVILSKNGKRYEIYEDNLRFIYPMLFKREKLDVAFDGEKFVIYKKED
ncbi:hypothetical protein J7J18_00830 [bacterium]|nr:hypothetical protein [Methanomicrobia archaeon]MCD6147899.1 hypothetical protein [bacterium]